MAKKIAINGFGRIGRLSFRNLINKEGVEIVELNSISLAKSIIEEHRNTFFDLVLRGHREIDSLTDEYNESFIEPAFNTFQPQGIQNDLVKNDKEVTSDFYIKMYNVISYKGLLRRERFISHGLRALQYHMMNLMGEDDLEHLVDIAYSILKANGEDEYINKIIGEVRFIKSGKIRPARIYLIKLLQFPVILIHRAYTDLKKSRSKAQESFKNLIDSLTSTNFFSNHELYIQSYKCS